MPTIRKEDKESKAQFDAVYPLVKKYVTQSGIRLLDLTNVFDGDELYYFDHWNVSLNGNAKVADVLYKYVGNHSFLK